MKKAYCVVEDLNKKAQKIIKENNIEFTINKTGKNQLMRRRLNY